MAADLFGIERAQPHILARKEAAALVEVLQALSTLPAVACCARMNTGAARLGARFVPFGWPGCPDALGPLKGGRILGVEVKGSSRKLRPAQAESIGRIRAAHGVAFVALDCHDVLRELQQAQKEVQS
ncbi:nuclease [beta proteobacterium AAP121]|nr:nuclease [beta proteobacterium AAP65]KPF97992.1 nuclease [beta proteobacterium AAP121]